MSRFCLDANIFITAWKVLYPKEVFFSLWEQLAQQKEQITIITPVYKEIKKGQDELFDWIKSQVFTTSELSSEMEQIALDLESEYETTEYSKGAGSIDIKLIAFAKVSESFVVTFEEQPNLPNKKSNYKVPTICREKNVKCISFVEFLRHVRISM